jgi:glutamate racemase
MVKIGVFDSGIGGQAVAEKLQRLFPAVEIISVNDSANVPYGSKSPLEIINLTTIAIKPLIDAQCDAIVIACNTATTNAISSLRSTYPTVHFVGIEPMVKPAAELTKSGVIAVLATPGTLASARYKELKDLWANNITVIEPDCSDWASLIELGQSDSVEIQKTVSDLVQNNVDVIVLGCTHYHWLKERIQQAAGPSIKVLEPSDAIGARLDSLLSIDSALPE